MPERLVIIGANDFQKQLIEKANALGYETHAFAWEEGAVGRYCADSFYPISIIEKDAILEKCRELRPVGICSIASDLAAITVNYVAEQLGLPCNRTEYSDIQTNKFRMRSALSAAGIECPAYVCVGEQLDRKVISSFRFPVIVKPTDRSGSRCIMKLSSADGIEEAVRAACRVSFEHKAIIEEYIDGDEYSMETITQNGVHHYLATTKKFTTGAPSFIETGHVQPSGLPDEVNRRAIQTVTAALDALHIENSAGHSEFKVCPDGAIRIIEIGARMGGDCIGSDLVCLSTGIDFMKAVIDTATGKDVDIPCVTDCSRRRAEIRFLFSNEDISRLDRIKQAAPETLYRISVNDDMLGSRVADSGSRWGYYIIYENNK